jgi:trk system potassium uptake protein TrkH
LRQRALVAETLGARGDLDLRWVLGHVLRWTLALETTGALLLFVRFLFLMPPNDALWHAVFHAVSAFCNAGFGLHDDSLTRYQGDWLVNGTVMALIISGGIGFPVLLDVARNWSPRPQEIWEKLLLHSKLMLVGSGALLLLGAIAFLVLEWDGVLAGMALPRRLLVALFHSTACRTAGFNTVDLRMLTTATLFLSILLMIVGAGPCSTGGGFKVSTFMVLVLRGYRTMLGYRQVFVGRRSISAAAVERATATAMVFSAVAIVALTLLLVAEQSSQPHGHTGGLFMDAAFEVFSALGTVGLSTGMTGQLSPLGRLIVILLMFAGRLGPISMFAALSRAERRQAIEYAQEEPLIG